MPKKRKQRRPPAKEIRRRRRIRAGLKRYHNDVRAVKKATGLSWRAAQQLIPPSVRRPGGRRVARADLLDVAKERSAVTRESEYVSEVEGPTFAPDIYKEEKQVAITYVDLLEYLIDAAKHEHTVEIVTPFYTLPPEILRQGPRASEIYRELGLHGDISFRNLDKKLDQGKHGLNYWRNMEIVFLLTFKYFFHGYYMGKGFRVTWTADE